MVIDELRWERWITVSNALVKIEPFFLPIIQGLGSLDSRLVFEDKEFCALPLDHIPTTKETSKLMERFTYSYLWVLGLYELVRTVDERCRENPKFLGDVLNGKIKTLKHQIERLRIPLAKMKPSKLHEKTDSPIAYPAMHQSLGISWQLGETTYISRRELSDETLNLFEEIEGHFLGTDS